jgi:putative transposase
LRVSTSWYYSWKNRPAKAESPERLTAAVKAAHQKTRGTYGAERLHKELLAEGHEVSLWKVKEIRREHGLVLRRKRKFVRTTDANHGLPVAPNLLSRNFSQNACNRVWVSDITYIPTHEGWLYLAGIKDLCSREIVGFSLSPRMDTDLVANALHNAFHSHRPLPGVMLHSDRGSQYCSRAYQETIKQYRMICSMSRRGDCYDNAPMESFWGLLKSELVHRRRYASHAEAICDITEYIEIFYNRQRRQAALGYLSPAAFAKKSQEELLDKAA